MAISKHINIKNATKELAFPFLDVTKGKLLRNMRKGQALLQENKKLPILRWQARFGREKRNYTPSKMNTKNTIRGTLALLLSSIKKQNPAARRVQAMLGKVKSNKLRLPKVSIV